MDSKTYKTAEKIAKIIEAQIALLAKTAKTVIMDDANAGKLETFAKTLALINEKFRRKKERQYPSGHRTSSDQLNKFASDAEDEDAEAV